ncbi:hypothetical protein QAD02_010058 [Eretmocerus hayati]|uniref:Uncharacterized protein n=1 Tax=Eretmocerus hayati TaxID=131215 RepID=A0ACC2NB40_9HYME|nr:hypothetical protein QAD02_010058 [Eretmocerus hayati]
MRISAWASTGTYLAVDPGPTRDEPQPSSTPLCALTGPVHRASPDLPHGLPDDPTSMESDEDLHAVSTIIAPPHGGDESSRDSGFSSLVLPEGEGIPDAVDTVSQPTNRAEDLISTEAVAARPCLRRRTRDERAARNARWAILQDLTFEQQPSTPLAMASSKEYDVSLEQAFFDLEAEYRRTGSPTDGRKLIKNIQKDCRKKLKREALSEWRVKKRTQLEQEQARAQQAINELGLASSVHVVPVRKRPRTNQTTTVSTSAPAGERRAVQAIEELGLSSSVQIVPTKKKPRTKKPMTASTSISADSEVQAGSVQVTNPESWEPVGFVQMRVVSSSRDETVPGPSTSRDDIILPQTLTADDSTSNIPTGQIQEPENSLVANKAPVARYAHFVIPGQDIAHAALQQLDLMALLDDIPEMQAIPATQVLGSPFIQAEQGEQSLLHVLESTANMGDRPRTPSTAPHLSGRDRASYPSPGRSGADPSMPSLPTSNLVQHLTQDGHALIRLRIRRIDEHHHEATMEAGTEAATTARTST